MLLGNAGRKCWKVEIVGNCAKVLRNVVRKCSRVLGNDRLLLGSVGNDQQCLCTLEMLSNCSEVLGNVADCCSDMVRSI